MRPGFSFVEVLVAAAILLVIVLAVVGALSSSARELKTTGEYSNSMFLTQKIVEDLIQSSHENSHYEDSLAAFAGSRQSVAGTIHPYFRSLEDSKDPWGLLQPTQDLGIEPLAPSLFRLYRDFNLTIQATDETLPPTPEGAPQAKALDIAFDWPGLKAGSERDYRFPLSLTKAQVRVEPTPLLAQDLPGMDDQIRFLIYPTESGDLSTVIARVKADPLIVRDVGAVVAMSDFCGTEASKIETAMITLETKLATYPATDPAGEGELHITLGGLHERKAALEWYVLLYLEKPAGLHGKSFDKKDLGDEKTWSQAEVASEVSEAAHLLDQIVTDVKTALHHFSTARERLGVLSSRIFRRMMVERKVIELIKMRMMLEDAPDAGELHAWLDHLLVVHTGRARPFAEYLARERQICETLATMRTFHVAVSSRTENARNARDELVRLAAAIDSLRTPIMVKKPKLPVIPKPKK